MLEMLMLDALARVSYFSYILCVWRTRLTTHVGVFVGLFNENRQNRLAAPGRATVAGTAPLRYLRRCCRRRSAGRCAATRKQIEIVRVPFEACSENNGGFKVITPLHETERLIGIRLEQAGSSLKPGAQPHDKQSL